MTPSAPVPDHPTFTSLREAMQRCRACELWEGATQAVVGDGAAMEAFVADLRAVAGWLAER
jgi:uracil-DNA glycosylase